MKIAAKRGCPSCGADIAWYDNVPILSWLILRARCRHCHEPISARYPAVEGFTAAAFGLVEITRSRAETMGAIARDESR